MHTPLEPSSANDFSTYAVDKQAIFDSLKENMVVGQNKEEQFSSSSLSTATSLSSTSSISSSTSSASSPECNLNNEVVPTSDTENLKVSQKLGDVLNIFEKKCEDAYMADLPEYDNLNLPEDILTALRKNAPWKRIHPLDYSKFEERYPLHFPKECKFEQGHNFPNYNLETHLQYLKFMEYCQKFRSLKY